MVKLQPIFEGSTFPKYTCSVCKRDLFTERSQRTRGREWLVTRDGKRHLKTKCTFTPHK